MDVNPSNLDHKVVEPNNEAEQQKLNQNENDQTTEGKNDNQKDEIAVNKESFVSEQTSTSAETRTAGLMNSQTAPTPSALTPAAGESQEADIRVDQSPAASNQINNE